jgi:WD40 repeat protein
VSSSGRLFFGRDGRLFVDESDRVEAWDQRDGTFRRVATWPYPTDRGTSVVAPTPDGSALVTVEDDGGLGTISTSDGHSQHLADGGKRYSLSVAALRPDGPELLVVQDERVTRLVELHSGRTRAGPAFGIPVTAAAYSPDGRLLAVTDGRAALLVWDTQASRVVRRIAAERVDRISFNPRGDRLVTITGDGRIAVWDAASGLRLGDLRVRQQQALDARDVGYQTALAWGSGGTELWTATSGGSALLWSLDPAAWIRSACAAAGRSLTADDWQVVGGRIPNNLTCRA